MERRQQKAARRQERKSTKGNGPEIAEMPDNDEALDDLDVNLELNPAGGLSRVRPDDSAEPRH